MHLVIKTLHNQGSKAFAIKRFTVVTHIMHVCVRNMCMHTLVDGQRNHPGVPVRTNPSLYISSDSFMTLQGNVNSVLVLASFQLT